VADGDHQQGNSVHARHEGGGAEEPERRAYPRIAITVPVEIDMGASGLPARGTTVNLSRSSALVSVRGRMEIGERCTIHFLMAGPGLVSAVAATVTRVMMIADGHLVALEFDDELPAAPGLR
jgi:hypothetical protein